MTYNIIGSGSSGNATIVFDHILIDCGVPFSKIAAYVKEIQLVLLTHEHGDHFRPSTAVLAFPAAAQVPVQPFQVPHNVPNCGWKIFRESITPCNSNIEKLFYATDASTLDGIEAKDFDLYMIECNHRQEEIQARIAEKQSRGEYAYEVEAARNHLSWEQAMSWLAENGPTSKFIPMHQHIDKE